MHFTHLLVEQKGKYFYENEDMRRTHEVLDTINCFSNIGVEYRSVFPIKIKTRPCVIILRRKLDVNPSLLTIPSPSIGQPPITKSNVEIKSSVPPPSTANLEITNTEKEDKPNNDEIAVNIDDSNDTEDAKDDSSQNADEEINKPEAIERITDTEEDDYDSQDAKGHENADDMIDDYNFNQDDSFDSMDNDDDQNIVETDLKRPTRETKLKLKKLIEKHYRARAAHLPPNDQTDLAANPNRPSIRSNIKLIIKKEKIKELIERISKIDLRSVCDLERESTKQCLLKIIDSFID